MATSVLDHTEFVTGTIAAGTSTTATLSTTLTSLTSSFFASQFKSNSNLPRESQCTGLITNTTTITWNRENSGATSNVSGYVVEFSAGVTVEHGSSIGVGFEGTRDITLSGTPDLSKSFLIWSSKNGGSTYGLDDNVFAYLWDDAGTIKIRVGDNGSGNTQDRDIEWSVVTMDDCSVARYSDTGMASGDTSEATAITAVTLAQSFLLASFTMGDDSGNQVSEMFMSARFSSSSEITTERDNSGVAADDIRFEVVTLPSQYKTQEITTAMAASDADNDITITAVNDTANAFIIGNMRQCMGNTAYTSDDIEGEGRFQAQITTTTNVNVTRNSSNATADWHGHVIEYVPGPTPITSSDTLPVGVTESVDVLVLVSPSYSVPLGVDEEVLGFGSGTSSDLLIVGLLEEAALAALVTAADSVSVQVIEGATVLVIAIGSDIIPIGLGELAALIQGAIWEQEGFRWRNDDGNEAGASWVAAQDTNASVIVNVGQNIRLRFLLDNSGVASTLGATVQFRVKDGPEVWRDVGVV